MDITSLINEAKGYLEDRNFILAKKNLLKIIKKYPNHVETLNNLAFIEFNLQNKKKASDYLKKSLIFNPDDLNIISNLGLCQYEMGQKKEALANFNKAILLGLSNPILFFSRASIYLSEDQYDKAELDFLKAIDLDKYFYQAYLSLSTLYNKISKYEKACSILENLLQLKPDIKQIYYNLAISYENQKNLKKAEEFYKKAINLEPNNYFALFNLSCFYLNQTRFKEGWDLFDIRWKINKEPEFLSRIPQCSFIDNNKNLLIWGEQGVGDQIIYSSIIQSLEPSNKIKFAFDKRLQMLFSRSFPQHHFLTIKDALENHSFDAQLPIGNLCKFIRNSINEFPNKTGFLKADHERAIDFSRFFEKDKRICGLSWRSANKDVGCSKSLDLSEFLPILKNDFTFVDLQYGDTEDEIKFIRQKYGIEIKNIKELDKFYDLDGLASLISLCDVVISVSNVTAHLSGALGKKTYVLTPYALGSLHYWHSGKSNLWYPSVSVRRQKNPDSWQDIIMDISKELN